MYIYLDESGNFYQKEDEYFIVGGFITHAPKRTAKAFRKWQHKKFPKKIRYKTEVKFNDTGLKDSLRLKTLKYFTEQDIRVFYSFFKLSNIPLEYREKDRIESGLLYAEVIAKTLQLLLPAGDLEFRVFRDKRHLIKISEKKFDEALKLDLLPNLGAKVIIQIEALDSASEPNIQIADWVCGVLFHYYNKRRHGKEFFSLLKNSIIAGEELFSDYWYNLNKKTPL